ncbi:MAG: hypothetical protein B7Z15_01655 [Rhizobiales bacterium 32-66-8]|nr:MAG: hypothetical protein B7Z15_01655 [Rhizobiales bacterium 32-66-8]
MAPWFVRLTVPPVPPVPPEPLEHRFHGLRGGETPGTRAFYDAVCPTTRATIATRTAAAACAAIAADADGRNSDGAGGRCG